MAVAHERGDLVHIPQAVALIDCEDPGESDPQLTIPLRVEQTDSPKLGVVTAVLPQAGYVRIFCEGEVWAVKPDSIYTLKKRGF